MLEEVVLWSCELLEEVVVVVAGAGAEAAGAEAAGAGACAGAGAGAGAGTVPDHDPRYRGDGIATVLSAKKPIIIREIMRHPKECIANVRLWGLSWGNDCENVCSSDEKLEP